MDWTTTHTTSPSYNAQSLGWLTNLHESHSRSDLHKVTSPPLAHAQEEKHRKYRPLLHLMQLQKARGIRPRIPTFMAPVVSHLGEFSTDVFEAVDWLGPQARRHFTATRAEQPLPPRIMTARFRRDLLSSLAVASAKGCALLLLAGGYPH